MPGPIVEATVRLLKYWPFDGGRPGAVDRVDQRGQVLDQLGLLEAGLAEGDVDDTALVDLELHAAGLDLADGALEVEGDRARTWGWA